MNIISTQQTKTDTKNTNLQNLEKLFFALFLLSIPIQTRLTFFTTQTYTNGTFNEYATFFLYLSDGLFIATLLCFFVNSLTFKHFSNIILRHIHTYPRFIPTLTLLITFVTWTFASIFWSEAKNIAFYQSIKLFELTLLFLYLYARLQWFGYNKFILLISITGFFESIIGIAQYYLQRSIGLRIFMESAISPETPNVAKIVVNGERVIRAYGAFPHPNVFSGFLLFSIFCSLYLLYSYKIVSRETLLAKAQAGETILIRLLKNNLIIRGFLMSGIIVQISALALTYSRTAWVAVVIILFSFIAMMIKTQLFISYRPELSDTENDQKPYNHNKLFHVKQFIVLKKHITIPVLIIIPVLIVISINWESITNRTQGQYQESIDNRIIYNDIAINMLKKHPVSGIGAKNYTLRMQEFNNSKLEMWQFQPVHNIYLLNASETGIIGLTLLLLFLFSIIKDPLLKSENQIVSRVPVEASTSIAPHNAGNNKYNVSRETLSARAQAGQTILDRSLESEKIVLKIGLLSILFGFLFIGLFDHYFWTLQQGQLTFWLVLGAITSIKR